MGKTGDTDSGRAVRILHLSDFHFKEDKEWEHKPIREGLLKEVKKFVDEGRAPDVVAITGDIAFAGKATEYALARTWIDEGLLKVLPDGFPKSRILIVPGNHDVDRKAVEEPVQGLQEWLLKSKSEEEFQDRVAKTLQNASYREVFLGRHAEYMAFVKDYGASDKDAALPWWRTCVEINGSKVVFAGLCSSWMSWSEGDQGRLLIGKYQVNTVFDGAPDTADFCVVLLHHPWDFIAEVDSVRVREEIRRKASLVVHGHLHLQRSEVYRDPDTACVELTAGSVYKGSKWPNAFQLIELLGDARKVRIHYRLWHNDEWRVDTLTYKGAPKGVAEFSLDAAASAGGGGGPARPAGNPRKYLELLRDKTNGIDIRGLEVGSGKATRMAIDRLYIPLVTASGERAERKKGAPDLNIAMGGEGARTVDLRETLGRRCTVVVGDPGAGKSTFLRRCAFELARRQLGERTEGDGIPWEAVGEGFPILIGLAELARHIAASRDRKDGPPDEAAPGWLAHFAAGRSPSGSDGLSAEYFGWRIRDEGAVVLLDGLDEGATKAERVRLRKLIEGAAQEFSRSRFVVTTRPAAYSGDVILHGFEEARIEPLEDKAIRNFLECWCNNLWQSSAEEARLHLEGLMEPLRERPEIRRMARNPVMLTALAVVHWNEKRLPEQRADLYESIIRWLAKSRELRPGRPNVDTCVALLQELALAMQDHPKGRQVQVTRHWGAERIAAGFRDTPEADRCEVAGKFLEQEEQDSGIIVGRGEDHLAFWHLTFQEYLAARALGGRSEVEQVRRLLGTEKLYQPEWREVVELLAGVLHDQGVDRVDGMVETILDRARPKNRIRRVLADIGGMVFGFVRLRALREKARCAGLLSGILYDLAPLKYRPPDGRYEKILDDVLAVFDAKRSVGVPIRDAIEAAEAIGQAGDPRFRNLNSPELWVTIPAGEFWMGAQKTNVFGCNYDREARGNESPVHRVRLSSYRIGRYPVTVSEYRRFVEDEGYGKDRYWSAGGFGKVEQPSEWEDQLPYPTRPMVCVNWYEASAYAAWAGCRLPTEAEWERAARGPEGRRYPWGDEDPEPRLLNFMESLTGRPTPVGVYPLGRSAEGVCDMVGNVWEWCSDRYGAYRKGAAEDPKGPEFGDYRVLRGGSFFNGAKVCRSRLRIMDGADNHSDLTGFRLAAGT